ncbi:MAG: GNAT family N-acetyltransferase [Clostridia bacterium]|nr:GNAT family N-acetyltransferase [Clostridia bacterium]
MEDFQVREAHYKDVPEIMNIINVTAENLTKKSMYFVNTKDFIEKHIEENGFSLVAMSKERIAGYLVVRFPKLEPDNLGKHVKENIDLNKVVHMESTAVLPEFRNKGIQKLLLVEAEKKLEKTEYCYYMGTVDPENEYSLRTLKGRDYNIIDTADKYGGLKRNIMYKEIVK